MPEGNTDPLWSHPRTMNYRIRTGEQKTEKRQPVGDSATQQVDRHRRLFGGGSVSRHDVLRSQELFREVHSALPGELILLGELPKNSTLGSVIVATSAGTITGDFHSHKQQQKYLVFRL